MQTSLKSNVDKLIRIAADKDVGWHQDARQFPKGDTFAMLGVLASRLGIPFSSALDPAMSEDDLRALSRCEAY